MSVRSHLIAGAFLTALALPAAAQAATGYTTGAVNMRTGPGTQFSRIMTIPAGARVDIRGCSSWCALTFNGRSGYVSANYVSRGYANVPPRSYRRPPPPRYGYMQRPWWDDRYHAWYDGRRWYSNGRWYDRPRGLTFGFTFGG